MTLASRNTSTETALEKSQPGFWKLFLIAFVVAQAIGGIGAFTTDLAVVPISQQAVAAAAGQRENYGPRRPAYAWGYATTRTSRALIVVLFLTNGLFNILWSVLFFQIKRPDWALIEVGALWGSVLIPLLLVSRTSKKAAWLLVPLSPG